MKSSGYSPALRLLTAVIVTAALCACAGPRSPLEVSIKQVGSDVTLGGPTPAVAAPPQAPPSRQNPTPLGFPAPVQVPPPAPQAGVADPPPEARPSALPTLDPCPPVDARRAAKEATNNISGPPATAILPYRNTGVAEITEGGETQKVTYPELSQRRINSGSNDDGTFGFSVAEQMFGTTTTSTYFVDPEAGLYLTGIVTELPDGSSDSFIPADPRSLLLLPLPVTPNVDFSSVGVDPLTQTSMSYDGRVMGKVRINACGTPLDAWEVQLTNGHTTSPDKQLDYTASYAIGTQYGGLSVQDNIVLGCAEVSVRCDSGRSIQARNLSVSNTEPALVARSAGAP